MPKKRDLAVRLREVDEKKDRLELEKRIQELRMKIPKRRKVRR